ncbi:hypothetical protein CDV36_002507 [Fusarium kuroshium]|uniref:Uncharacterized protein n=1 Tax=Fusarium kuroshium TaxID=2010991 RepID=A0A3M2SJV5_9HYPO|nr:hypothetical protein CDV36_002507 [Fusarium kuroshium]
MTDIFTSLPPELRLGILLHLNSRSRIAPLLKASPCMLAQYQESKILIRRGFIKAELADGLLQDALAVVLFPQQDGPIPKADRKEVQRHVERWSQGQLPDPFHLKDYPTIESLDRLYHRLSTYIEDYITKATSKYPPRAYLCLPDLSSKRGRLLFRNKQIGQNVIKIDYLTDAERRRLLQAFLRYEFLCKVNLLGADASHKIVTTAHGQLTAWECEAIQSVYSYIQALYGATYAHFADSWLPDIPNTLVTEAHEKISDDGLRFPDNVYFDSNTYFGDMNTNFESAPTVMHLAFAGFDPITTLLMFPRDETGCPQGLIPWLSRMSSRYEDELSPYRAAFIAVSERTEAKGDLEQSPRVYQSLRAKVPGPLYIDDLFGDPHSVLQLHVCRQRAWVFMDDARLYPHRDLSRHFPTLKQLRQQRGLHAMMSGRSARSIRRAALRRQKGWHEEREGWFIPGIDRGRWEKDVDPGQALYGGRFFSHTALSSWSR